MLSTIEATINPHGQIVWSEPVQIKTSQKILITFLEKSTPISENNLPLPIVTLDQVAGCLAYKGNKTKTLEDMEKGIAEGLKNEKTASC